MTFYPFYYFGNQKKKKKTFKSRSIFGCVCVTKRLYRIRSTFKRLSHEIIYKTFIFQYNHFRYVESILLIEATWRYIIDFILVYLFFLFIIIKSYRNHFVIDGFLHIFFLSQVWNHFRVQFVQRHLPKSIILKLI